VVRLQKTSVLEKYYAAGELRRFADVLCVLLQKEKRGKKKKIPRRRDKRSGSGKRSRIFFFLFKGKMGIVKLKTASIIIFLTLGVSYG